MSKNALQPCSPIAVPSIADVLAFGNNSVGATTTTRYMTPWYSDTLAETDPTDNARIVVLRPVTLQMVFLRHGDPGGNGGDIVYTLRKNAAATILTLTLASTGLTASNLVDQVDADPGDTLDVEVTKAAGVGSSPNDVTWQMLAVAR